MATFVRGTETKDKTLTPLRHGLNIFKQYLAKCIMTRYTGKKDSGMPIIVDDTLTGGAGDTVRFHFIPQNDTEGILGQNKSVAGNEDVIEEFSTDMFLDVMKKAFKKKGKMTTKRIIWKWRDEVKNQLSNWFSKRHDVWLIQALTGVMINGFKLVTDANMNTTVFTNGDGRCIIPDATDGSKIIKGADVAKTTNKLLTTVTGSGGLGLTKASKITVQLIEELQILASHGNEEDKNYRIEPFKMLNGEECFLLMVDKRVARDLKRDSEYKAYRMALVESGHKKDPIGSGALCMIDNIIIVQSDHIVSFKKGSDRYARNLFMGANAAAVGWAQKVDYDEKVDKIEDTCVMKGDEVRGQTKITFNGVDMGVAQVITAAN